MGKKYTEKRRNNVKKTSYSTSFKNKYANKRSKLNLFLQKGGIGCGKVNTGTQINFDNTNISQFELEQGKYDLIYFETSGQYILNFTDVDGGSAKYILTITDDTVTSETKTELECNTIVDIDVDKIKIFKYDTFYYPFGYTPSPSTIDTDKENTDANLNNKPITDIKLTDLNSEKQKLVDYFEDTTNKLNTNYKQILKYTNPGGVRIRKPVETEELPEKLVETSDLKIDVDLGGGAVKKRGGEETVDKKLFKIIETIFDIYKFYNSEYMLKIIGLVYDKELFLDYLNTINIKSTENQLEIVECFFVDIYDELKKEFSIDETFGETFLDRDTAIFSLYSTPLSTPSSNNKKLFSFKAIETIYKIIKKDTKNINILINTENKVKNFKNILNSLVDKILHLIKLYPVILEFTPKLSEFYHKLIYKKKRIYTFIKIRQDEIAQDEKKIPKINNPRYERIVMNNYIKNVPGEKFEKIKTNYLRIKYNNTDDNNEQIDSNNNNNNHYSNNYETYNFGRFDGIYPPEVNNKQISENIEPLIIDKLTVKKEDVCIIGYGQSGSGKTSALIYLSNPAQDGIIIELCKSNELMTKFQQIKLTMKDIYIQKIPDRTDPTDPSKYKIVPEGKPIKYKGDETVIFEVGSSTSGKNWVLKVTPEGEDNKTIGEVINTMLLERETEPTSNNPDSSRSHVIFCIEFIDEGKGTGPKFVICDLAGVENKFQCDDYNEILKLNEKYISSNKYKQNDQVVKFDDLNNNTSNNNPDTTDNPDFLTADLINVRTNLGTLFTKYSIDTNKIIQDFENKKASDKTAAEKAADKAAAKKTAAAEKAPEKAVAKIKNVAIKRASQKTAADQPVVLKPTPPPTLPPNPPRVQPNNKIHSIQLTKKELESNLAKNTTIKNATIRSSYRSGVKKGGTRSTCKNMFSSDTIKNIKENMDLKKTSTKLEEQLSDITDTKLDEFFIKDNKKQVALNDKNIPSFKNLIINGIRTYGIRINGIFVSNIDLHSNYIPPYPGFFAEKAKERVYFDNVKKIIEPIVRVYQNTTILEYHKRLCEILIDLFTPPPEFEKTKIENEFKKLIENRYEIVKKKYEKDKKAFQKRFFIENDENGKNDINLFLKKFIVNNCDINSVLENVVSAKKDNLTYAQSKPFVFKDSTFLKDGQPDYIKKSIFKELGLTYKNFNIKVTDDITKYSDEDKGDYDGTKYSNYFFEKYKNMGDTDIKKMIADYTNEFVLLYDKIDFLNCDYSRILKLTNNCKLRTDEGTMINTTLSDIENGIRTVITQSLIDSSNNNLMPIFYEKEIYPECIKSNSYSDNFNFFYDKLKKNDSNNNLGFILDTFEKFGIVMSKINFIVLTVINMSYTVNDPPNPPYININNYEYNSNNEKLGDITFDAVDDLLNKIEKYKFYTNENLSKEIKDTKQILRYQINKVKKLIAGDNTTLKEILPGLESKVKTFIDFIKNNNSATLIGSLETTDKLQNLVYTKIPCGDMNNFYNNYIIDNITKPTLSQK